MRRAVARDLMGRPMDQSYDKDDHTPPSPWGIRRGNRVKREELQFSRGARP